jgi:S1-C subfamily serine protease
VAPDQQGEDVISIAKQNAVAAATVRFLDKGGQGVLVKGGFILTAAHVVKWDLEAMSLGDDAAYVNRIRSAKGRELVAYPLAVEPVSDLAVLGAVDEPAAAIDYEQFCEETEGVPLAIAEFSIGASVPAYVLTHTGKWITGRISQWQAHAERLSLETDEAITGGTSGSPIVTEDGLLLGVASIGVGQPSHGPEFMGLIPRPHLVAPAWLAKKMLRAISRR